MKINIVLDTICPWSFVGKRGFARALGQIWREDIEISWEPYQINPTIRSDGLERRQYLEEKFGDSDQAYQIQNSLVRSGIEAGIKFSFEKIKVTPNTLNSHRLIHFGSKKKIVLGELIDNLFVAFFVEGEDIGNIDILSKIAHNNGLDPKEISNYFNTDEDIRLILGKDQVLRCSGIQSVPCYIIDEKYMISGAQPSEVFQQVFDLAGQSNTKQP